MYFVEIVSKDETLDMDGCIQFRISDSGIISADFVDGSAHIYQMREGDEVIRTPISDEDIHEHPELGPWYHDQIAKAEAKAAAETPVV